MPRSSLSVFATLLLALTILALPQGATTTSGIVTRGGQQFLLNGAPYRAGGSNQYYTTYRSQFMCTSR